MLASETWLSLTCRGILCFQLTPQPFDSLMVSTTRSHSHGAELRYAAAVQPHRPLGRHRGCSSHRRQYGRRLGPPNGSQTTVADLQRNVTVENFAANLDDQPRLLVLQELACSGGRGRVGIGRRRSLLQLLFKTILLGQEALQALELSDMFFYCELLLQQLDLN